MNQLVCRCCLIDISRNFHNLFENQLREKLLSCVPVLQIEAEDGLPQNICEVCHFNLNQFLEFSSKCKNSENELRQIYEDTNKAIDEALHCMDSSFANIDALLLDDYSLSNLTDDVVKMQTANLFIDELLHNASQNIDFDAISLKDYTEQQQNKCDLDIIATTSTPPPSPSTSPPILSNLIQSTEMIATETLNELQTISTCEQRARTSTTTNPHICLECGKNFTRNFQLQLHKKCVHNAGDGLPYKCTVCNKEFASRSSLNYHFKSVHSSDRPHICDYCPRRFVLRTQLLSHQRTHTGELKPRTLKCEKCDKYWSTKSDLRLHMRSHNPNVERPFKCDLCEKCFYSRGHLKSHYLVHTGEKPFICTICQKSYQSIGNLNNHIARNHTEVR